MSNIVEKYIKLVDALLAGTKSGKIPWEHDANRNTVFVWNKGNTLLVLKRGQDENYDDLYSITILNKSGDTLEHFYDTTLPTLDPFDQEESYFDRLKSIYELATRQATGADKALDDFITAIEHDDLDEVPF